MSDLKTEEKREYEPHPCVTCGEPDKEAAFGGCRDCGESLCIDCRLDWGERCKRCS